MIVLAVIQRQRHDLIDRHDSRVAECGRKHIAEFGERLLDSPASGAALADDDRRGVGNTAVVRRPGAVVARFAGGGRNEVQFRRRSFANHLKLDAPLAPGSRIERAGRHQVVTLDEIGGQADFNDRRRADAETRGFDRRAVGMAAEYRRVETPGGIRDIRWRRGSGCRTRHRAEQRPTEGSELSIKGGVGMIFGGRRARREQLLNGFGVTPLLVGTFGGLPFGEDRSRWNFAPRANGSVRLGIKMPHRRIAKAVGVRIAGQNVAGNVAGQIPSAAIFGVRYDEIDRRQVAGVISVSRGDEQRNKVARPHRQLFDWADLGRGRTLRVAGGETLPRGAAAELQRPAHAVAALGMGVLDFCFDSHRRRDRAFPTDGHPQRRRGMDRDAVRTHVARNADVVVGRIGHHAGRFGRLQSPE